MSHENKTVRNLKRKTQEGTRTHPTENSERQFSAGENSKGGKEVAIQQITADHLYRWR